MRYKAELEREIRRELKLVGPLTDVRISDDGSLVVIQEGDKCTNRRLSELGKKFLRRAPEVNWVTGESFLEPEDDDSTAV